MQLNVDGLMFMGDPHLTSRRPGQRREDRFYEVILKKMEFAIELANLKNYAVLITGDLFDREKENKLELLTGLFKVLAKAEHPVFVLAGNHDLKSSELDEGVSSMALLEASGRAVVMHGSELSSTVFNINGKKVGLGFTVHDREIPEIIERPADLDQVIWMTHHNIAFPGVNFGTCQKPFEIKGVDLVVNGHLHKTYPTVVKGKTTWINPGNITRMSIDTRDHVPKVLEFVPGEELTYVELPHLAGHEVFDMTSVTTNEAVAEKLALPESEFAALLATSGSLQNETSGDGSLVMQALTEIMDVKGTSEPARVILNNLIESALLEMEV